MIDSFGREIEYLRVSVTQKCNLKCIYCVTEDAHNHTVECVSLTPGEYEVIIREMVKLGIKRIRITGGEPLTRPDICDIISRISKIEGITDLSMTTNGIKLFDMAEKLKKAGLMRVNISLDSLENDTMKYITRGGRLEKVVAGIEKALEIGLMPVKINTVLIKGINDHEIKDFIELARQKPVDVRFIELMPIGQFGEDNKEKIVYNADIIHAYPELVLCEESSRFEPAQYYKIKDFNGRIGFISPMSHKFCDCCNRIRLTCDGKIKLCLGHNSEYDILNFLRQQPEKIGEYIRNTIYHKPRGHNFEKGFQSKRNMNVIGG